jgi:hypothetical protein
MKIPFATAIAILLVGAAAPAAAQTVIPVSKFRAVELRGGGRVILRHGPVQRVTMLRGSSEYSSIETGRRQILNGGRVVNDSREGLVIEACRQRCPRDYRLEVEIVTPDFDALAVSGGGEILLREGFPRRSSVALAANGGGTIDARALSATSVAAAANGGGTLLVRPDSSLAASVRGGGTIRYWGNPSVVQSVKGGGTVVQVR